MVITMNKITLTMPGNAIKQMYQKGEVFIYCHNDDERRSIARLLSFASYPGLEMTAETMADNVCRYYYVSADESRLDVSKLYRNAKKAKLLSERFGEVKDHMANLTQLAEQHYRKKTKQLKTTTP